MRSKIMQRAWKIRKEASFKFSCKISEISMSLCLKIANDENHFENLDFGMFDEIEIEGKPKFSREKKEQMKELAIIRTKRNIKPNKINSNGYLKGFGFVERRI